MYYFPESLEQAYEKAIISPTFFLIEKKLLRT